MTYVINANWGGFAVPNEIAEQIGCDRYAFKYGHDIRTDERLIEWVKAHKGETDLALVNIPDEATDWRMDEYDGWESILAVIDGKIVLLDHE